MALRKHFSLTASTHSSVTITAPADVTTDNTDVAVYEVETHRINRPIRKVTVVNHGSTKVFYRFNGTAPTSGGADDDFVVPANGAWTHENLNRDSIMFVLISSGAVDMSLVGE